MPKLTYLGELLVVMALLEFTKPGIRMTKKRLKQKELLENILKQSDMEKRNVCSV